MIVVTCGFTACDPARPKPWTLGTNADPKIPASKLAVATAVANLFLMI
jgi:hypothetical protein